MFDYIWPIALVVVSNTIYQICTKSVPEGMDPFASLTVTYLVGALVCGVLFFTLGRGGSLLKEYSKLNWAPIVLGLVIVGLEVGFIFAYRAGWPVSTAASVTNVLLAVVLLFVGCLGYQEPLTWNKAVGVAVCLVGIVLINMK